MSKKPWKSYQKKESPIYISVWPGFRTKLKTEAASKGISIIEYTKQLTNIKSVEEEFQKTEGERKKLGRFEYRF